MTHEGLQYLISNASPIRGGFFCPEGREERNRLAEIPQGIGFNPSG